MPIGRERRAMHTMGALANRSLGRAVGRVRPAASRCKSITPGHPGALTPHLRHTQDDRQPRGERADDRCEGRGRRRVYAMYLVKLNALRERITSGVPVCLIQSLWRGIPDIAEVTCGACVALENAVCHL